MVFQTIKSLCDLFFFTKFDIFKESWTSICYWNFYFIFELKRELWWGIQRFWFWMRQHPHWTRNRNKLSRMRWRRLRSDALASLLRTDFQRSRHAMPFLSSRTARSLRRELTRSSCLSKMVSMRNWTARVELISFNDRHRFIAPICK